MRGTAIALAGVGLLAATACGGSGAPAQRASSGSLAGGPQATTSRSAGPLPSRSLPPQANRSRPSSSAASGVPSAHATRATGTGTSPPARSHSHTSGSPQHRTAPGGYTYDVSGTSGGRRFSDTATLAVSRVSNGVQTQRMSGSDIDTSITYRYTTSALQLLDLKLSGQVNKEFRPRPPVVQLPLPLQTGRHWSYDLESTDRSTTIHGEFATPSNGSATVGGRSLSCTNVTAHLLIHLTYSGRTFTVTDDETQCLSATFGLALHIHDTVDAGFFGKSDSTSALRSVQPH